MLRLLSYLLRGLYKLLGFLSIQTGSQVWRALLRVGVVLLLVLTLGAYIYFLWWFGTSVHRTGAGILSCVPLLVTLLFRRRIKGAVGEAMVRSTLAVWFPRSTRFHDIELPIHNSSTQIDHILICSRGVFVIETKNWSGVFHASRDSEYWAIPDKTRKMMTIASPSDQNAYHLEAVAEALLDTEAIFGIVAMVGSARIKGRPAGVARNVADLIVRIHAQPVVLSPEEMQHRAQVIRMACIPKAQRRR